MTALLIGAALIGLAVVALAFLRPQLALITLVVLDVSNINGAIAEQIGTSPYKAELGLAVVVLLVMVRRRQLRMGWSPVLLGLLILFAGFCLSLVAAADPVTSQALLISRTRDLFYFLVVFALVLSTGRIRSLTQAAVTVLAALAALTVVHEFVLHNSGDLYGLSRVPLVQEGGASTPRHAGTSSDVNFWARLLILFTPLSLSLWAASRQRWPRLFWARLRRQPVPRGLSHPVPGRFHRLVRGHRGLAGARRRALPSLAAAGCRSSWPWSSRCRASAAGSRP